MGEQQLAAVKEYIAKYNLEDELSTAVNHAIKADSDDPFRVISDYLRTLANVRARVRRAPLRRARFPSAQLPPLPPMLRMLQRGRGRGWLGAPRAHMRAMRLSSRACTAGRR